MTVTLHSVSAPADALHLVLDDFDRVAEESDGAVTREELIEALLEHEAALWLVLDGKDRYAGCIVTEFVPEAIHTFVHIVAMRVKPGADGVFDQAIGKLSEWAHSVGARLSGTSRRPGMGRRLARLGWEERFVEYVEPEVAA